MKTKLLMVAVFCLIVCRSFAQETSTFSRYVLTKNCTDKIKVYQSHHHKPFLAHYKYMTPRYWIIKVNGETSKNDSGYVRIFIPDNEMVSEPKALWGDDGATVGPTDYNTWLYIKKSDLERFKPFRFSDDYSVAPSYYQQMMAQTIRH